MRNWPAANLLGPELFAVQTGVAVVLGTAGCLRGHESVRLLGQQSGRTMRQSAGDALVAGNSELNVEGLHREEAHRYARSCLLFGCGDWLLPMSMVQTRSELGASASTTCREEGFMWTSAVLQCALTAWAFT